MNLREQVVGLFLRNFKGEKGVIRKKRLQTKRRRTLFLEGLEARQLLAAFTPGNLAVYRVGDGSTPLANTGNPVFIDEYSPAGALVQSIAMPTSGTVKLISSGVTASEGMLTLSPDGKQLALTGYNPTTAAVVTLPTSSTSGMNPVHRSVAIVDSNGAAAMYGFGTSTITNSDPRSAIVNGNILYISGGANGIRYVDLSALSPGSTGNATNQLSGTETNVRDLTIAAGQLFATASGSGTYKVGKVGNGTPASGGQVTVAFPDTSTLVSPHQIFLADLSDSDGIDPLSPTKGLDTFYISSDNSLALQKYSFNGSTWVLKGTIGVDADDYRGLTGSVSGTTVTLYAVRKGGTSAAGGGELVKLVDSSGYNGAFAGTPTLLASASTGGANNTAFRGVAFVPTSGIASAPEVNVQGGGLDIADEDAIPSVADGTEFGSLVVGETLTHTFTIQNTGSADLTLSNPISSNPNFSILDFPAGPIAAGAFATFDVKFTAASATTFSGTISFDNNDSDEATYNFAVSGSGEANQPPVFVATGPYSVPENSAAGTAVGTVTASDPNGNQTLSFSALGSGTGAALFNISVAGQITVKSGAVLDLESISSYSFGVRVSDSGASPEHTDATVIINLSNVNEAPVFAAAAINRQILAGRSNGAVVVGGAISATDPDAGDSVVSYAIVGGNGTGAGAFAISSTGVISVNDATQIATAGVMNLQVTAIDSFGLASVAKTVTVTIVGNLAPVLDQHTYFFTVDENQPNNSEVGDPISATDPNSVIGDTFTFSIISGNGSGAGAFNIDALTGQIRVKDSTQLDREATASFVLTVRVTDSLGLFDAATVNISIFNTPEAPVFPAGQEFSILENSANGATVGAVQATFDAFGVKSFSILGGNGTGAGAFAIDSIGKITVNDTTQLDYEGVIHHQFSLSIRARDTVFNLSTTQTVIVKLINHHEGTILAPGDLLLTGIDGDDNDEFTFAPLVNLAAKTEIRFTDAGWLSSGGFRAGEGVIVYVAPAGGIAAGTELGITKNGTTGVVSMSHGAGTVFDETGTTIFGLGTSGDSLIAFQGTTETPTPLFAITTNRATFDANAVDGSTTALPTGLTLGVTAVAVGEAATDFDNAEYMGPTTGSASSLLTSVSNSANWAKSDSRITFTYQDFMFGFPPTDIGLSNNTVAENAASGATVGVLSTVDPDIGDAFMYLLVAGAGADDNGSFTLDGAVLKTTLSFDFEAKPSYTIRVRSTDSGGLFVEKAFVIGVTNVNEEPTAIDLSNKSVVEKEPVGAIVGSLSTTDPDNGDHFTYTLVSGVGSDDNASFAIDGGVLKSDQIFDFLTKNSYRVRIRSTDSGGLSTEQAFTIAISDVRIGGFAGAAAVTYKENALPILIASVGTVADVQLLNFDGGTLTATLTANGTADDRLSIKNVGVANGQISVVDDKLYITKKISNVLTAVQIGNFSGGVGTTPLVITFNANAFRAEVQATLRAITFQVDSESPSAAPRTANFVITDGDGGISNTETRTINVISVNDKPVVTVTGTFIEYTEDGAPMLIDSGVGISDVDSADFAGGKLTVKFVSGAQSTDRFEILASELISIDEDAKSVSYLDTVFGTYAGTSSLTVMLNEHATSTIVQELARHITYRSLSNTPTTATRNVSFSLSDGGGATSVAATANTVKVTAVNDNPTLTVTNTTPATYKENAAPLLIASSGVVTDLDATDFDRGVLTAWVSTSALSEDRLFIKDVGTSANQIHVDADTKTIYFTNSALDFYAVGTYIGGEGDEALVITFNHRAFKMEVQATLRAIAYENRSENPSSTQRQVTFTLTDGDDGATALAVRDIKVAPKNDVATIENLGDSVDWTIGPTPVLIAESASVNDVDSADFSGGRLTVALTGTYPSVDRIVVLENDSIKLDGAKVLYRVVDNWVEIGTFTGSTKLTVTFNGNATLEAVSILLRRVAFRSTSTSTATRTVNFTITDGDGGAAAPALPKLIHAHLPSG